jgi:hypothetical protein
MSIMNVYTYNGILVFSLKKEDLDAHYNMEKL